MTKSISFRVMGPCLLACLLASGAMAATPAQQANAAQEASAASNLKANLRNDAAASRSAARANATECSVYRAGPRKTIRRCRVQA